MALDQAFFVTRASQLFSAIFAELSLGFVEEYPAAVKRHNGEIEHRALLARDRLVHRTSYVRTMSDGRSPGTGNHGCPDENVKGRRYPSSRK